VWNHSCRHECRGISGKRTGKTAHFLSGGDRLAVVETSKNTSRPAYLILRSGTAAAANYGEARGAESRADFIHKLKIVLKELNETSVWLELIVENEMLPADKTSRAKSRLFFGQKYRQRFFTPAISTRRSPIWEHPSAISLS